MREAIEPTVRQEQRGGCDPRDVLSHPAYATVTMVVSSVGGGGATLFGSDLKHGQCITIRINQVELHRDLHRDWIHGHGRPLVEFSMSHAQFAQFITSVGNGEGTPCTLRWTSEIGSIPDIKNIETKHETHRREVRDSAKQASERLMREVERLGQMLEGGSVSKKELRDIHHTLKCHVENLPSNMAFAVKSAEEALEKATSDAKIEVESYIGMTAQRLGLKHISELAQLEHKAHQTERPQFVSEDAVSDVDDTRRE